MAEVSDLIGWEVGVGKVMLVLGEDGVLEICIVHSAGVRLDNSRVTVKAGSNFIDYLRENRKIETLKNNKNDALNR